MTEAEKRSWVFYHHVKGVGMSNVFITEKGDDSLIEKQDFQHLLKVGDKVSKIGDSTRKGMAYHNRESGFISYVTYAGTFTTDYFYNGKKVTCLAFKVRPDEAGAHGRDVYLLYGQFAFDGKVRELHIDDAQAQVLIIHQLIFTMYDGEVRK